MHGKSNPVNRDGTLNPRNLNELGRSQYAWNNATTPFWQSFQVTADGVQLVDQKPKEILAIIRVGGGSGQGGSGNKALPANDQENAYEWEEGYWTVENDDFVVRELVGGRSGTFHSLPAIERNNVNDVPDGYVTWIKPAWADGNWFYEFDYNGEMGSGSGNSIPAYCDGELSGYITIDGDSVSFESI